MGKGKKKKDKIFEKLLSEWDEIRFGDFDSVPLCMQSEEMEEERESGLIIKMDDSIPDCIDFHVPWILTDCGLYMTMIPPDKEDEQWKALGPIGQKLLSSFSSFPGVNFVHIERYSVRVFKGYAFKWPDIIDRLVLAVEDTKQN